jgi:hypothetical protein
MANMSYCRFRNTKIDLVDCVYALKGIRDGEEAPLSLEEYFASEKMYDLCQEYIQLFEELEGDDAL